MAWRILLAVVLLVRAGMAQEGATYEGHPPAWWVARLADEAPDVRQEAAFALGRMGPASEEAVPALAKALADADEQVRREAMEALGAIGPASVPVLIEALRSSSIEWRQMAARQLGRLARHAAAAVPALAQAARSDKGPYVRMDALEALASFRPLPPVGREALLAALRDEDYNVARDAARVIGGMGEAARDLVPDLVGLSHEYWSKGPSSGGINISIVLFALARLGPVARPALPMLLERLASPVHEDAVPPAIAAIGIEGLLVFRELFAGDRYQGPLSSEQFAKSGSTGLVLLAIALRSPDREVRLAAIQGFAVMSDAVQPPVTVERRMLRKTAFVPWLLIAAHDRDYQVRQEALRGISHMGVMALPILREALSDRYEEVRSLAVKMLGELGSNALPVLMEALRNRDPQVVYAAASHISRLKGKARPAVPALVELLREPDIHIIHAALEAFRSLGPVAAEALPALQRALQDDDAQVRFWAVQAIGGIGKEASSAAPLLLDMMRGGDPALAKAAADALPNLAPLPAEAVHMLLPLLDNGGNELLPRVLRCLGAAGHDAEAAVPRLLDLFHDPKSPFRPEAIEAIAHIWPMERSAPVLSEALESQENRVQITALALLESLGPPASSLTKKVVPLIMSTDVGLREMAWRALVSIGTADPEVAAILLRGVEESQGNERFEIANRIVDASESSGRYASVVFAMLNSRNEQVRYCGLRGISNAPETMPKAVPALIAELRGGHFDLAARALARMGETAKGAVPAMARALSTSDASTRKAVLEALAQMGPVAEEALPAIREMCHDPEPEVAKAANEALQRIEAK